jgi:hypothetical protein
MVDPWELVLHHTYAGTPGVILDHSPSRRSHGQPVNLTDADFLTDGVQPGSGAVRFDSPASMIRVPPSESWGPLGGVRIEMLCETDLIRSGGALVTGDSFEFNTGSGFFSGSFVQAHGTSSVVTEGGSEPRPMPPGDWMTLVLQHDPGGVHVDFNGDVVASWERWDGLLAATSGFVIGNDKTGHNGLVGRIDDIKVWRLNPHLIGDNFVDRPVDNNVGRCWAEWSRKLDAVLKSDPRCASQVATLLQNGLFSVMGEVAARPEIQSQLAELRTRYQELWSEGRLAEIPAVLADVIGLLRSAGFNPANIAAWQALQNDACFRGFLEQLPMNCDQKFTDIFSVSESF